MRPPSPAGLWFCFNPWAAQGGWQPGGQGAGTRAGSSGMGGWGGQGLLGPPPQAHTAFAPLQQSSQNSAQSWDQAGLIAALPTDVR